MPIIKKYANIKEVSEYTGVAIKTLYDWAARGIIPSIKAGKKVLFDLADVDAALTFMKRNIPPPAEVAAGKADEILSNAANVRPAKHGKVVPLSSGSEAYNKVEQHNQRDLSEGKGGRDV